MKQATKQRKRRAGVAARSVTQRGVAGAAISVTASTALPVTQKRAYKPRARKCACGCGVTFTPTKRQPKQRFATDACRQRAHRAKQPKRPRRATGVDKMICQREGCGQWYVGTAGKGRKYCTSACKRLAAQERRDHVAAALAGALAMPLEDARDRVELVGMVAARRAVEALAG